jgi:hypothetical protein
MSTLFPFPLKTFARWGEACGGERGGGQGAAAPAPPSGTHGAGHARRVDEGGIREEGGGSTLNNVTFFLKDRRIHRRHLATFRVSIFESAECGLGEMCACGYVTKCNGMQMPANHNPVHQACRRRLRRRSSEVQFNAPCRRDHCPQIVCSGSRRGPHAVQIPHLHFFACC